MDMVRDTRWYERHRVPLTRDGVMPFAAYVIRERGRVEVGNVSCAMCHTRVMPDGTTVAGAQGNFPFEASSADAIAGAPERVATSLLQMLAATPWDKAMTGRLDAMTAAEFRQALFATPPGVIMRQGTSIFAPPAVPDLIGIRERKYLDKTGLGRHRGAADIMRYAAMNQTLDMLGNYGGFVPTANDQKTLPPPGKGSFAGSASRYSDAQLYALAQFIYSLTPPPNPNRFDDRAKRGQAVFTASGCARCHTPPLYTANRLVPADGFTVPADHRARYDILDVRVGTDPTLTMSTRRGTGYYKIPSLKGVWYRGPFEHNGSVATLEDWFNPARLRDDYVPTGWIGPGLKTRAVKGHPFGLGLSDADKAALIAFLKTL
jgi:mono/diheme cytochrome c family protein